MTKHNVVVPEELTEMAITATPTDNLSKKASLPMTPNDEEYSEWLKEHPSALSKLEEITASMKGKQLVMFLDYDGTLSPIVSNPDLAFMSEDMRQTVKDLAKQFPTAIVSGRRRDKVQSFVKLGGLYYAGSHGMDIKVPNFRGANHTKSQVKPALFQPANEFLPMINEVYAILLEATKSITGALVENNKFCLSVHYRCVDEKRVDAVSLKVKTVLQNYPKLHLTEGKKVWEVRPLIDWNKGKALEYLMESLGFSDCDELFPIYIGDDRTDEDAFKVLSNTGMGLGILVSHRAKETKATYSLREPAEVMQFLRRLVEWKKSTK